MADFGVFPQRLPAWRNACECLSKCLRKASHLLEIPSYLWTKHKHFLSHGPQSGLACFQSEPDLMKTSIHIGGFSKGFVSLTENLVPKLYFALESIVIAKQECNLSLMVISFVGTLVICHRWWARKSTGRLPKETASMDCFWSIRHHCPFHILPCLFIQNSGWPRPAHQNHWEGSPA